MDLSILSKINMMAIPIEPDIFNFKNFSFKKFNNKGELIIHFKIFDKKLNSAFFNNLRDTLSKSKIALVDPDGMFGIDYPVYAVVEDLMERESIDESLELLDITMSNILKKGDQNG